METTKEFRVVSCVLYNNIVVGTDQIPKNPFRIQSKVSKHETQYEFRIVTKEKPQRKCQVNLIACFKGIQAHS